MLKRNGTPSLTHRKKTELIPHPPKKKIVSIESDLLILPMLKDNIEGNKLKNDFLKNNFNSSKKIGKNRLSIDYKNKNVLSPINTELNHNKKRGSECEENSSKYLLKIKGKMSLKENDNSKEKNPKNNFNINKKKKNINNIQTEFLPILNNNNQNDAKLKFPLIDKNMSHFKSDKKINNKIEKKSHHKYKSDTLLNKEYILQIKKYATYSRKGTEEDGKNKENNQDISIILNNICQIENYSIYGIMDGHGSNGHLVSNFVKEKIEEYFNNKKIYKSKKLTKAVSSLEVNLSDKIYEKLINNNYELIKNFYNKVNQELYDTKFDIHFSGTTCVLVFKIGQKIICSNVGDSRAILVKNKKSLNNNDKVYEFIELSHDHKPENKEERERIEKSGGEVAQEYLIGKEEPTGPFRVWCKGYDYPGIAISRSLGDKIAELIGVISEPDILNFDLDDNCKYIIMGSDGLFDYLTNNDIMNIANPFLINYNPEKACHEIVDKAANIFKEKEGRIDDITINIIIL